MSTDDEEKPRPPPISTSHMRLSETAQQIAVAYQALGRHEHTGPKDAALCRRLARKARTLSRSFATWATLSANIEAYEKKEMAMRLDELATQLGALARRLHIDLRDIMK